MKKIAIINDISGYGRCSISVIQPIVSHLGVQGCPLPTAIFSNHTGFPSFYRQDFTSRMPAYIEEWKKLDLQFDGIMTGFLGSARQIGIVEQFIKDFRRPSTIVLVDPVMGDNGHIYPTYTRKMCRDMKRLIQYADIITPNLTEACFLTDTPYKPNGWRHIELVVMARELMAMGAKRLVITGIKMGENFIGNVVGEQNGDVEFQRQMIVEDTRRLSPWCRCRQWCPLRPFGQACLPFRAPMSHRDPSHPRPRQHRHRLRILPLATPQDLRS